MARRRNYRRYRLGAADDEFRLTPEEYFAARQARGQKLYPEQGQRSFQWWRKRGQISPGDAAAARKADSAAFEASLQRAVAKATARGATPAQIEEMKAAARRGYPSTAVMDPGTAEYQRRRMMAYELYLKAGDKLRDAASSGNCEGLMSNWMKYKYTRGRGDYFLDIPRRGDKSSRDLGVVTRQLDVMSSRVGSMMENACSLSTIGIKPTVRAMGPQKAATSRAPKALTTTFTFED